MDGRDVVAEEQASTIVCMLLKMLELGSSGKPRNIILLTGQGRTIEA